MSLTVVICIANLNKAFERLRIDKPTRYGKAQVFNPPDRSLCVQFGDDGIIESCRRRSIGVVASEGTSYYTYLHDCHRLCYHAYVSLVNRDTVNAYRALAWLPVSQ